MTDFMYNGNNLISFLVFFSIKLFGRKIHVQRTIDVFLDYINKYGTNKMNTEFSSIFEDQIAT